MKYIQALALAASLALTLTACGGGDSGPAIEGAGGDSGLAVEGGGGGGDSDLAVEGGGVKGPLVNAQVAVYRYDASLPGFRRDVAVTTASTNDAAAITGLNLPSDVDVPLLMEISSTAETTDLTTGTAPIITRLRTVLTQNTLDQVRAGSPIYATPLSTLAVDLAIENSIPGTSPEVFSSNLSTAAGFVLSTLGFGLPQSTDIFLSPPVLLSQHTSLNAQSRVAEIRIAIEAISAIVVDIHQAILQANPGSSVTTDHIMSALAVDLIDGVIDGTQRGTAIPALRGVNNIADIIAQDPSNLMVPGTAIPVTDIEQILVAEAASTCACDAASVSNFLADGSVDVEPETASSMVSEAAVADSYPRVVSAISTGNQGVILTFSKAMNRVQAASAEHYAIVQTYVNSEVGNLAVTRAEMLDNSGTTVELVTSPQNEVTYTVMVTNVTDTAGGHIEVASSNAGTAVLHNSAEFAGSPPSTYFACTAGSFGDLAGTACAADRDCWDPAHQAADPDPAGRCEQIASDFVDSDGDGISDDKERRGYTVILDYANGEQERRQVTSDPFSRDTDGDGINDRDELRYGANPRDADSDSDGLDDNLELNTIYSSPYQADSDGDSLEDGLEYDVLQTSPIHADSDGDQLSDDVELFVRFRDPRIADLPKLEIVTGSAFVTLLETYSYTDASGEEVLTESSSTAEVSSGTSNARMTMNEQVHEDLREWGVEITLKGGLSEEGKEFVWIQGVGHFNIQFNDITTTGSSEEIVNESLRTLQDSRTKGQQLSSSSEVVRNVDGALLNLEVNLRNAGDMAFSVSDLEITLMRLRPGTRTFEPITTLVPQVDPNRVYHIGPFDNAVGPVVFSAIDLPVGVAEDLLRNAGGLAFKVSNYAINDEYGRQFSFIDQEVADRTAGLLIDYGFEGVERQHFAASGVRDLATGAPLGAFDAQGRPSGLPLTYFLENQLGWERNPTTLDAIIAGPGGVAQTVALGDDVQRVPLGTRGLGIGEVIIEAGPNGVLDSSIAPQSTNVAAVTRGFGVSRTCGTDAPAYFQSAQVCDPASAVNQCACTAANDCPDEVAASAPAGNEGYANAQCNGPQVITRVRGYQSQPGSYRWVAFTDTDASVSTDIDAIVLKPGESFALAFVQDLDADGLFGRDEFTLGSTDSPLNQEDNLEFGDTYLADGPDDACAGKALPFFCLTEGGQAVPVPLADSRDTDRDGLDDYVEVELGWEVAPAGQARRTVYPSPILRDSDGDGLTDLQERDIRFACDQWFILAGPNRHADRDYNDSTGVAPYLQGVPVFSEHTVVKYPFDYQNRDFEEAFEYVSNPFNGNAAPDDGINLPARFADASDAIFYTRVAPFCVPDDPDPLNPGRTLSHAASLDPENPDTDGDGVSDGAELFGYDAGLAIVAAMDFKERNNGLELFAQGDDVLVREYSVTIVKDEVMFLPGQNGKLDADYSDIYGNDALVERPAMRIRSNPLDTDTDDDRLLDGTELLLGTNPVDPTDAGGFLDSDGDGVFDRDESRGFSITVNGAVLTVYSNPSRGDTDDDGLPDFVEYQTGTSPENSDTDGDGLSDYDEFGAAQFAQYARYAQRFDNFSLDSSGSAQYETNPNERDTDDDTLPDGAEIAGYSLVVSVNGVPTQVYAQTNPLSDDSDVDGLLDVDELTTFDNGGAGTHPGIADTDGDGRVDGVEFFTSFDRSTVTGTTSGETVDGRVVHDVPQLETVATYSNPLETDGIFELTIQQLTLRFPGDEKDQNPDWDWKIDLQSNMTSSDAAYHPGEFPGVELSSDESYVLENKQFFEDASVATYVRYSEESNIEGGYVVLPLDFWTAQIGRTARLLMKPGDDVVLSGQVGQYDGLGNFSCSSSFLKSFTFEELQGLAGRIDEELNMSNGACEVFLRYSVRMR